MKNRKEQGKNNQKERKLILYLFSKIRFLNVYLTEYIMIYRQVTDGEESGTKAKLGWKSCEFIS